MSIGNRILQLRNTLQLSQAEFGEKIGLKYAAIGLYEKGKRNVSDRSIADISREFGVNEYWLRTGEGEMFKESNEDDFYFNIGLKSNDLDELDRELILSYMRLDENQRSVIKNWMKSVFNK